MDIKVGSQVLSAARPADLDQRLIAATGCSAAEHAAILSNPARLATPLQIATVLAPMLAEPMTAPALAALIGEGAIADARQQALALLKEEPNVEAAQ